MLKLTLRLGFIAATLGLSLAAGVGCSRNQAVQTDNAPLEADASSPHRARPQTVCGCFMVGRLTTPESSSGQRDTKDF